MVRVIFKDEYWVLCNSVYKNPDGGWDIFGVRQDSTGVPRGSSVHHEGNIFNIQDIPSWWIEEDLLGKNEE